MKYATVLLVCLFLFHDDYGQTKDYRAVTTKYSDGTTLTLGGYGDPSQYSFSNKTTSATTTTSGNNVKSGKGKLSKKEEREQNIEMIEMGSKWTYSNCSKCSNENKSKDAYKKFIKLVNEKRYGEALDFNQNEVNAKFTEEKPDDLSFYRYYGLVIFCERQCMLKYPSSQMKYVHNQSIQGITKIINAQLALDLAKPGININEYKLQAYSAAGIYDEAKKVYSSMQKSGAIVDRANLISVELHSSKPDELSIIKNSTSLFDEKLKTITGYTAEQSLLRAKDEDALGSFLVEILYTVSQVDHTILEGSLPSFLAGTYNNLKASFITAEGEERLVLAKAYFTEFGIQN